MKNCFNEAEASLPRNTWHQQSLQYSDTSGFNEAEASLPRNTAVKKRVT